MKCKHCGYEWDTNSKLIMVTCPNCSLKNKREEEDGDLSEEVQEVPDLI